jgi:hypothetical protein
MAIEFHCSHCGHLVRTANEHAGKRGKCPSCHNSVYIPTPSEELEPLDLAPLDDSERREQQRAEEESRRIARALLAEKGEPTPELARGGDDDTPEPLGDARLPVDMESMVTDYVLAMAEGDLSEAENLAVQIRLHSKEAEPIIDRLSNDEMPPRRLTKVPRGVLIGFLKQLRGKKQ